MAHCLAGHAYKIPARQCYEASTKDGAGNITNVNPSACY